jgi:hypothetical protein
LPPFPALRLRQTIVSAGEKAAVFPSAHRHDAEDDAHLPSMEPMVGDIVGRTNDAAARAAPSSDATTPV